MNPLDIVTQKLTGPAFPEPVLRIKQFTSVRYVVRAAPKGWGRTVDDPTLSQFFLAVPALGLQSPLLSHKDSFTVEFTKPGVYSIECLQLPTMTQRVVVTTESEFIELESDSNETASIESGSISGFLNSLSRDTIWTKRPRTRRKTAVTKSTAFDKEIPPLTDNNLSRFKKTSNRNQQSMKNQETEVKNSAIPPRKQNYLVLNRSDEGPSQDTTMAPSDTQIDTKENSGGTDQTQGEGLEVLEWVNFASLGPQAVQAVLIDLKAKYEINSANFDANSFFCGSFDAFDALAGRLVAEFSGNSVVPKGQSHRRVRRAHQRMETRLTD
jgi:hypothetical protein